MQTEIRSSSTMTQQESLKIMAQMIAATRQKMERNDSKQLLLWGYLSLCVTILVYGGIQAGWSVHTNWLWFAIPLIGWPCSMWLEKKESTAVTSYADGINNRIWSLFGGILGILPFVLIFTGHSDWILRLEMLFLSNGITTSGLTYRSRPFTICGLIGMLIVCPLFSDISWSAEVGCMALIFILTLIVPGHILNAQNRRHV